MSCKRFLECLLSLLNLLLTVTGLATLLYGIYLYVVYKHAPDHTLSISLMPVAKDVSLVKLGHSLSNIDKLPKAWFLYLLIGIGVVLCVVSCWGCLATLTRNQYCLSCYAILVSLLILVELLFSAYIYFDGTWEDKIPTDNTGNLDAICEFLEDHWETLQWVALAMLILEVFVFFLALAVRDMNRLTAAKYDSEEEWVVPKYLPTAGVGLDHHLLSRHDSWRGRMREKYGLEFTYNPSESTRSHPVDVESPAEQRRTRCRCMMM